jgi:hypothetical protein
VYRFWIDKECSPEEDSSEKQTTTTSMDAWYRRSRHPIGPLAVILETQDGVNFLQTLMMGDTVIRNCEDEYPRLDCSAEPCAMEVFDVCPSAHKALLNQTMDLPRRISLLSIYADLDSAQA